MNTKAPGPPPWQRLIGIVGGLGPYAHIEFERLLLRAAAAYLGHAAKDQDYPSWILSSLPGTPDRTNALLSNGAQPVDALVASAERLSAADFGVIPCNTAHAFLELVRERVRLPLLDMIGEAANKAIELSAPNTPIGILGATGTLESGLYQKHIAAHSDQPAITLLDLQHGARLQESLVMVPIFGDYAPDGATRLGGGIKSGAFEDPEKRPQFSTPMARAAELLAREGAEVILMACTEIPLVLDDTAFNRAQLLDPMAVAADAAIEIASGKRELPT